MVFRKRRGWKKEGDLLVKKLIGLKTETKLNLIDRVLKAPIDFLSWIHDQLWGPYGPEKKEILMSKMASLSPGERKVVEAIQNKLSKIGFKSKFRMIYWGRKEVFSKGRGIAAVIGAIKQFNTLDMNGFKPDANAKTAATGLFPKKNLAKKQIAFLNNYQKRNFYAGANGYILNIEELATLFHFPMRTVKAPLLKRAETRRAEPPVTLPTEGISEIREVVGDRKVVTEAATKERTPTPSETPTPGFKSEPPDNLPIVS